MKENRVGWIAVWWKTCSVLRDAFISQMNFSTPPQQVCYMYLTVKHAVDDEKILQNLERQFKLPYFLLKAMQKRHEYHMKAVIVLTCQSKVISRS